MHIDPIHNYQDFCTRLRRAGFSMAGDNGEGIFTLCDHFGDSLRWHTGDPETDPWAFRMRVLTEEKDIGYGKLFYHKGGYVTREWAPCFLALRRGGQSYREAYQAGRMSFLEKNICRLVEEKEEAALFTITAAFGQKGVEAALARLQTGMFLTISGQTFKLSKENMPYGWPATTFRLADSFWGDEVAAEAWAMSIKEARERITEQVFALNPQAERKAVERFLR